jgi:hypothetical protein
MGQKIKFASGRPLSGLWSPFGPPHVRQWPTSGLRPHRTQAPASAFERVTPSSGSLIVDRQSRITAFLIDTPAIRIVAKSFHCIADSHSNRHSSRASEVHYDGAVLTRRGQIQTLKTARLLGQITTGKQKSRKGGRCGGDGKKRGARGVSGGMMAFCTGGGLAPATEPLLGGCS